METNNYIRSVVASAHSSNIGRLDKTMVRLNKLLDNERVFMLVWNELSEDDKMDLFLWTGTMGAPFSALLNKIVELLNNETK